MEGHNEFTSKNNKAKLGLLELAKSLGSISSSCKAMGYSRDSYYRFKELYETGGAKKHCMKLVEESQ